MVSSSSSRSAWFIQRSRRSFTSPAINPSPKLSWARRISITALCPRSRCRLIRTQQFVIELANRLDGLLELLIVRQPATHHLNHLAAQAELPRAPARIAHRQHRQGVTLAAGAFGAAASVVADGPLQQRSAQDLTGYRQSFQKLLARRGQSFSSHSYK